jgi:hypothetical protein
MPGDYDHTMVTARCWRCARPLAAAFGELRETGLFSCICGAKTGLRSALPQERTPFSHDGWYTPDDIHSQASLG